MVFHGWGPPKPHINVLQVQILQVAKFKIDINKKHHNTIGMVLRSLWGYGFNRGGYGIKGNLYFEALGGMVLTGGVWY